jgi:hypothetical protein
MSCVQVLDSSTIELNCMLSEEARTFRFQPDGPFPDVVLALNMDDEPLTARQLYSGRFGLHLLEETSLLSRRDYQRTHSQRPPNFLPGFDPGVFLWNDGRYGASTPRQDAASGNDDEFAGETINDGSAREVLKGLGYWQ